MEFDFFEFRLVRQEEIGLFDRTWKRWVDLKPKCEVQRIGFVSVGLEEFRHVLLIFIYGVIASLVLFCFERLLKKKKKNLEKLLTRKITNF